MVYQLRESHSCTTAAPCPYTASHFDRKDASQLGISVTTVAALVQLRGNSHVMQRTGWSWSELLALFWES